MRHSDDDYMIFEFVILFIAFVGIIATGLFMHNKTETKIWNNGYHADCGGKWEYEQAVGHKHSTSYIYICDKCGERHEFESIR